jgi:glycosyltransferase involved in cell wall biosynthesis
MARRRGKRLTRVFAPGLGVLNQHAPRPLVVPVRYKRTRPLKQPPVISIVTPSLNYGEFIERTMSSVIDQDYPGLEYVVQDGGSSDDTLYTLERYSDRLHKCESVPDGGQASAINEGFRHTTGDIMAYLNADDIMLPGSLAYVARYFAKHPDVDAVYSHRVVIDAQDMEIGRWVLPRHDGEVLSWVDFVPQETLFWRRSLWNRAGGVDESLQCAFDWDLLIRFRNAGAQFARLPRFLGALRVHGEQKMNRLGDVAAQEANFIREQIHGRRVTQAEMLANVWPYLVTHLLVRWAYRMRIFRY